MHGLLEFPEQHGCPSKKNEVYLLYVEVTDCRVLENHHFADRNALLAAEQ